MTNYVATVEVEHRADDVYVDVVDALASRLARYQPAVGPSVHGRVSATFVIPSQSLGHAALDAATVVSEALGREVCACEVATEDEAAERESHVVIPELMTADEAAAELDVTTERVQELVKEQLLQATTVGREQAFGREAVEAFGRLEEARGRRHLDRRSA